MAWWAEETFWTAVAAIASAIAAICALVATRSSLKDQKERSRLSTTAHLAFYYKTMVADPAATVIAEFTLETVAQVEPRIASLSSEANIAECSHLKRDLIRSFANRHVDLMHTLTQFAERMPSGELRLKVRDAAERLQSRVASELSVGTPRPIAGEYRKQLAIGAGELARIFIEQDPLVRGSNLK